METPALAVLTGLATVVVIHYLEGGPKQARTYLDFVFTGRGPGRTSGELATPPAANTPLPPAAPTTTRTPTSAEEAARRRA